MTNQRIIFNASMCKAGSEMLQAVLDQHPDIYASPTSPLIDYLKAMRNARAGSQASQAQYPGCRDQAFNNACHGAANGYASTLSGGKPVFCDKNREWINHVEWTRMWTPQGDVRIVAMVRDLRDVVASFERTYRANGHVPFGENERGKEEAPGALPVSLQDRVKKYLAVFPPLGPNLKWIAEAAKRGHIIPFGDDEKPVEDKSKPILCVRYEDFCGDPGYWIKRIERHLKVRPFGGYDFSDLSRPASGEIPGAFGPFGNHRVSASILPPGDNAFRDVLGEEDEMFIAHTHQWFFELFKYI
jgi:hypothetical protein